MTAHSTEIRTVYSVTLRPSTVAAIDRMARRSKQTRSALMDDLLSAAIGNPPAPKAIKPDSARRRPRK